MQTDPLTALSPLDGRYAASGDPLRSLFSEFGLIRHRVHVEIEWLLHLSDEPAIAELAPFSVQERARLRALAADFSLADARAVKAIEARTNHDVKAVEYFLRERLSTPEAARFVHFACTSEDINNLSYALAAARARDTVLLPAMDAVIGTLSNFAGAHADTPMLSRTHGQTASPTTLGKEFANVSARLARQRAALAEVAILGKMNGAVGNYNAHHAAYPDVDWPGTTLRFVNGLGLTQNPMTTQIEPHDWMAEYFDALARFNTVMIDFCRDVWGYVSLGYLAQQRVAGEVGSSTMPHKINPINFENAEGNFGCANALLQHLARKLPISRWQRDLTDSTVLRNIGLALGWTLAGLDAVDRGMARVAASPAALAADLDASWEVLGEAIQTVMKRHGIDDAYEQLKALTRGERMTPAVLHQFIDTLALPDEELKRLHALTPATYTGLAGDLVRAALTTSTD